MSRAGPPAQLTFAAGVLLVVIMTGSLAYFQQGAGPANSSSTSSGTGSVLISLGQKPRLLGPGVAMNYTMTIVPGLNTRGTANISSTEPPGFRVSINPNRIVFSGSDVAVDVLVSTTDLTSPGTYKIQFVVSWSSGSTNFSFDFRVLEHLVVLLGGGTGPGPFVPSSISVNRGDSVTWLSLDGGSDEYGGQRSVRIIGANASSPTLTLYSVWSYTFNIAGTFQVEDPLNSALVRPSVVEVA